MFYVSFLVKEGRAKVFVDPDNNLPKICPVRKAGTQVSMFKNAFSFSLTLRTNGWILSLVLYLRPRGYPNKAPFKCSPLKVGS